MNDFWGTHWWLIIILLAMCFPIAGMIMGAWTQHNYFRHRREALETLKIYAQQGKEPPPEVMNVLGGWGWGGGRHGRARWRAAADSAAGAAGAAAFVQGDLSEARTARYAAWAARWRAREPFRRWHNAIFMSALTAGIYLASQQIHDTVISGRFLVAAIIVGALAGASVLSAILVTVIRPK